MNIVVYTEEGQVVDPSTIVDYPFMTEIMEIMQDERQLLAVVECDGYNTPKLSAVN